MRLLTYLVAVLAMVIALSSAAECGVTAFEPSISIGEEYNDNVYLAPTSQPTTTLVSQPTSTLPVKADYITHVIPSVHAVYSAPFWDWSLTYAFDYRYYAHDSFRHDYPQTLNLVSTTRIVKDLLFFDVRDSYGRTSLSSVQNFTQQSLVKNLTDYNLFEVNPYTVLQLTSSLTLTAGYQQQRLWYKDPTAINQVVNSVYGDFARSVAARTSLTALVRYDGTETSVSNQYRTTILVGARYEYQNGSHLWGSIGAINTTSSGSTTGTQPAWEAGIIHTRPTWTLSVETGRMYIQDPLIIDRREDRYLASLRIGKERTNGGISFGLRNYGEQSYVDERRYSTAVDFTHFLTERLQARYALNIDRYEQYPVGAPSTTTVVYITDVRLDYHVSESTVVSLNYVYTDSYSPEIYSSCYKVNRALIGVKKTF